jgi:glycosyltransferase involved in cell wall biosynthesis
LKITLVLATFGRTDELERLISSLARQTRAPHELVVVDQNADDRVLPFVQQAFGLGLRVRHVRMDHPNLSEARNLGINLAEGDVVAFPDDDCWYEPEVIATVCRALEEHPGWAGVTVQWVEQAQARSQIMEQGPLSWAEWQRFRGGDASSISLFIRIQALRSAGGFCQQLGVGQWFGAAEEIDLLFTLLKADAKIVRLPMARVHHRFAMQSQRDLARDWRAQMRRARGTGALYAKHRLPLWVAVRGVLAPAMRAALKLESPAVIWLGLAIGWGRLQGAIRWLTAR